MAVPIDDRTDGLQLAGTYSILYEMSKKHTLSVAGQPAADLPGQKWLDHLDVKVFREREMHNYGGGREYNTPGTYTPCSVVWGFRRRVLQITWDLFVIPCCFDFNAEIKLGNLRTQSLEEIFSSLPYTNFIEDHIANRLEAYPVCVKCERCYRP